MRIAVPLAVLLVAASRQGCGGDQATQPPPDSATCASQACGASCVWDPPCRSATPPCMMPSALGHCDAGGACIPGGFAGCAPDPACVGKKCGDACDLCGGACMTPVATACDYAGRCVPVSPTICFDPCAGKACGEQCHVCPPDATDCFEAPVFLVCDAAGICGGTPVTCP